MAIRRRPSLRRRPPAPPPRPVHVDPADHRARDDDHHRGRGARQTRARPLGRGPSDHRRRAGHARGHGGARHRRASTATRTPAPRSSTTSERRRVPDGVDLWLVPSMNPDGQAHHVRAPTPTRSTSTATSRRTGPRSAQPGDVAVRRHRPGQRARDRRRWWPSSQQIRPTLTIWYHQDLNRIAPAPGGPGRSGAATPSSPGCRSCRSPAAPTPGRPPWERGRRCPARRLHRRAGPDAVRRAGRPSTPTPCCRWRSSSGRSGRLGDAGYRRWP